MNLRTRKIENVTDGKAQQQDRGTSGGAMAPTVSPDGRHLAFARRLPDGTTSYKGHVFGPRTALWLRDLQSGAERFLMDPIELDLAEEISRQMPVLPGMVWSSDGRSIVLSQGGKLRRLDVETGAVQTIPFTARVQRTISEMAWSPLAISDGPFQPKMIRWTTASPDGKRLLFQAVGKLWIQDLPGGTPRRLTPASFTAGEFSPSWSPDGAAIAFASWDDSEHGRLWIIPGAGGTPSPITTDPGEYLNPMWSPDGKSLAHSRGSGATLRGRGWARNEWYDVVVQRVEVGEPRAIDRLDSLESPGPRARFGPQGRIYFCSTASRRRRADPRLRSRISSPSATMEATAGCTRGSRTRRTPRSLPTAPVWPSKKGTTCTWLPFLWLPPGIRRSPSTGKRLRSR
jgi:Tol biopolymer transport system component